MLAYWFLAVLLGKVRCLRSLKRKLIFYSRSIPYIGKFIKRDGYIDLDIPQSSPVRDAIINHVCGPYKTNFEGRVNWSGIIQLLRMILVFCSVLIHRPWERTISMWTVSLISLSIHAKFEPLQSKAMNFLAFLCQLAIVFVGGLYIYLASLEDAQVSPLIYTDRITIVYAIINVFSVIVPGICIALTILCGVVSAGKWIVGKCKDCLTNASNQP